MKKIWLIIWILLIPGLGIMVAWNSKGHQPGKIKDILVLSVAGNADSTIAVSIEKAMANALKKSNYRAESAIEHFGKNAFSKIREEETLKQLYPYDAVLILSLVNEDQRKAQISECNEFFWEYYDYMYSAAHSSQALKVRRYFWEVSFFEISNWKLQYRMQTSSFLAGQAKIRVPEYTQIINRDMLAKQIINPVPEKLKAF